MPSARTGLPLIFSVASCALRVRSVPLGCRTRSPIFTSFSLFMNASPMSGLWPLRSGGAADQRRPVGDRLVLLRRRQIFAGRKNGRGRPNRADRRHVNMLGGKRDERAGRAGVGIDVGVSRDRGVIQNAGDFFRRIEPATIRVHVEDNRRGAGAFRCLLGAAEKKGERGRDLPLQRNDHDVALPDRDIARRPPSLTKRRRRKSRSKNGADDGS